MRMSTVLLTGLATVLAANLMAAPAGKKTIPGIGPVGRVQKLHTDFKFTEGPTMDREGNVYFSDIPENKIYRVDPKGKLSVFTASSGHANGLMVDGNGRMFACQMDGQVVKYDLSDKSMNVVAAEYNGKRFNAPNDLVVDKYGGVFFTDPSFRAPKPLPQGKTAVYYVSNKGKVTRLIDDLPNPNGVILSPDEKVLYVIPSGQAEMMAYPVVGPGQIGKGKVFCRLKQTKKGGNRGGDGLTVDSKGNLYITSRLGLQVFNPQGKLLGIIELPEQPANVTFGGDDLKTLYVTARTSLYIVPMAVKGHVISQRK